MKILLTGIAGQLGGELQRSLASLGEVVGVGRETLDLAQPESISQAIREIQPDTIVNAAAYTAVDKAETETDLATVINAIAPKILAQEAQQLGATLVHISTDYVFDGQKNTPYTEEDAPHPLGVYGQTKLAGEEEVREACEDWIILRTAWVYSAGGKNFAKTMLRLGAEREELRVVADQVGTPTRARDIAQAIQRLLHIRTETAQITNGTYHFTNSGVASWYDFAVAIFEEAKLLGFPLRVQRVVPITTPEYPTPAKRPPYSVLAGQKIAAVLETYPAHWRESLRQMLIELYRLWSSTDYRGNSSNSN